MLNNTLIIIFLLMICMVKHTVFIQKSLINMVGKIENKGWFL